MIFFANTARWKSKKEKKKNDRVSFINSKAFDPRYTARRVFAEESKIRNRAGKYLRPAFVVNVSLIFRNWILAAIIITRI